MRTYLPRPIGDRGKPYSPFRYPGGKTWFMPWFRGWLASLDPPPEILIEPFAGGATASLTAVIEGYVPRAEICELDPGVAGVWHVVLYDYRPLAALVRSFEMTPENLQALLARRGTSVTERALQTIVRNRTAHNGILLPEAGFPRLGENGKGILSRWYPETLVERMARIHDHNDRVRFYQGNGFTSIVNHLSNPRAAFFVDPPYIADGQEPGSRLYACHDVAHVSLFKLMAWVRGPWMMTYADTPATRALAASHGMRIGRVPMVNAHHEQRHELVITSHPRRSRRW